MIRDSDARSWQVTPAIFLTPALTVVILVAVLGSAEIAARTPAVRDALYIPSVGSSSRRFELQLFGLQRYVRSEGPVDCLILGNSTALMGVDPGTLNRSYHKANGRALRCYNFGVDGMTASAAGAIAPILVEQYRPRLLIYIVSARDVGHSVEGPQLAADAWVQHQVGRVSFDGWLTSHSALFRYFLLYRQWLDPMRWPAAKSSSGTTTAGYFALDGHLSLSPQLWSRTQALYAEIAKQPLSAGEMEGFARLVALSHGPLQVVVVEAPAHERLRRWVRHANSFYKDAITHMRRTARQQHVAFWRAPTRRIIAPDAWADFVHLDRGGATDFSEWLGARVARAVSEGRLDAPDASGPPT